MKNIYKIIILFILLVIALQGYSYISDAAIINDIALRFQVTPSWVAIRDEIFYECKPGMTRDEVHKILDKVGPWKIDVADSVDHGRFDSDTKQLLFRENIYFTEEHAFRSLGYWGFLFDKNGKLVRQGPIDKA